MRNDRHCGNCRRGTHPFAMRSRRFSRSGLKALFSFLQTAHDPAEVRRHSDIPNPNRPVVSIIHIDITLQKLLSVIDLVQPSTASGAGKGGNDGLFRVVTVWRTKGSGNRELGERNSSAGNTLVMRYSHRRSVGVQSPLPQMRPIPPTPHHLTRLSPASSALLL